MSMPAPASNSHSFRQHTAARLSSGALVVESGAVTQPHAFHGDDA